MGDLLHSHLLIALFILAFPFLLVLWVVPMALVCKKAGFSPWLTLLNCIPFGTPVLIYLLAFADWKISRAGKTRYENIPYEKRMDAYQEAPASHRLRGPQLVVR